MTTESSRLLSNFSGNPDPVSLHFRNNEKPLEREKKECCHFTLDLDPGYNCCKECGNVSCTDKVYEGPYIWNTIFSLLWPGPAFFVNSSAPVFSYIFSGIGTFQSGATLAYLIYLRCKGKQIAGEGKRLFYWKSNAMDNRHIYMDLSQNKSELPHPKCLSDWLIGFTTLSLAANVTALFTTIVLAEKDPTNSD